MVEFENDEEGEWILEDMTNLSTLDNEDALSEHDSDGMEDFKDSSNDVAFQSAK